MLCRTLWKVVGCLCFNVLVRCLRISDSMGNVEDFQFSLSTFVNGMLDGHLLFRHPATKSMLLPFQQSLCGWMYRHQCAGHWIGSVILLFSRTEGVSSGFSCGHVCQSGCWGSVQTNHNVHVSTRSGRNQRLAVVHQRISVLTLCTV
jgi:hypothetical protein